MKSLQYVFLILILLSQTGMAADNEDAEKLLKSKMDAVIQVLQKNDLEQQDKQSKIVAIVSPMFDFPLMARLSLGKEYWPNLTPEQKEIFSELFIKRLKNSYLSKFTLYTDEKVTYDAPVQVKKKVHIPTYLVSKDKKISMLYKFYESKHSWKIYDIEIQGVSIIKSYRSQFDEILRRGTFEDLLDELNKADNTKSL
jgi:phospholipid transport system substrate-binding protein